MRHLKHLFMAVTMTIATAVVANTNPKSGKSNKSDSYEIEQMLDNSNLIVEDDFRLKIVFSLSEDKKIQVRSIKSDNEEINGFLRKRLENQVVYDKSWVPGKLYELPVKVEATR